MEKNVTGVEAKEGKFGMYKTLFFEDGSRMSITKQNRCYEAFTGPGVYDIVTRQYNGKEVIASATKLNKGVATAAAAVLSSNKGTTAAQAYEDRLAFDRQKQLDIRVECYMGIAKDIAIANKKENEPITAQKVGEIAFGLIAAHENLKDGRLPSDGIGLAKATFPGATEVADPKVEKIEGPTEQENFDLY